VARLAEERALSEARTREHMRAIEAARLLRATQEANHPRLTQEDEEKAKILRCEAILLAARKEIANLATALA
jgi:hypothetical protein